ncbi:hypothetical protein HELRODRAFT_163242 [Helobdella robusta]|uniref:Uncharacterized protein n=2 Tax=Helobdella robusta TaxID=6412 RepID=T1ETT9_HELRO|nr:hypothetical protein HELRODRAFT_163242 [Helobdella robusta]ESN96201.1 hypothetical protein HELRODRAFT_163242 [Helobdella robusta]
MPKTRKELFCEVFGLPTDLLGNVLPTNSDVMKCYLWNRNLLKESANGKDPSKSLARKAKEEARLSKIEGPCAKKQKCDNLAFDEVEEVEEIKQINFPPDSSEEYKPSTPSQLRRHSPSNFRKSVKLPNLAQACDRTGISDRSASLLVNAVLQDLQIITKTNSSQIVDRSKIRRERTKRRAHLQNKSFNEFTAVRGLYFDGRKDKTIQQDKKGTKYYRSTVTEEHVVLLSEPGSLFLGHVSPMSGSAKNITLSIKTFLKDADSNINELKAIGCDGTVINTGLTNGVIRQLELFIGRPLQWHICLLHTNELPLRLLIQFLDGKTSNPRCFSGEIGKMLENCEKLSIAAFEPIETELPSIHQNDLSTDQTYLFDICNGIMKGDIPLSLSLRNPGKMSHSRWITTANRILRLYVAVQNPSTALKVLGRNAYFAHPENILLSMLADEQKHIRELALRRILKCRANDATLNTVRVFKVPKLNFDAINYYDMIDWHATEITEPPLTKDITTEALEQMIMDIPNNIEFLKLPCHTQAVERMIKLVTEASLSVCGEKARDGFIRTKLASQNDIPKFETKKHFII